MINYLFSILGIIVIVISIFFINREFKSNILINSNNYIKEEQMKDIIESIETIENIIGDINEYFCNTIIDFEKKYSNLEHMIDTLNQKVLTDIDKDSSKEKEQIYYSLNNNISDPSKDQISNNETYVYTQTKNHRRMKIFELKNKGLSVHQIAKELNIGTGEVQLMLNINKK